METVDKDEERRSFLDSLDEADVTVSEWEAKFLESNMTRTIFTPGQRVSIDKMMERYRNRVDY